MLRFFFGFMTVLADAGLILMLMGRKRRAAGI
jgi:hypothetical protein